MITFKLFDLTRLRAEQLEQVPHGRLFIYGNELTARFRLNEHECWVPVSGERAMLLHEYRGKRATVALIEDGLTMRAIPRSDMQEPGKVSNPFAYALVTASGFGIGMSGLDDCLGVNDPGRMVWYPGQPAANHHNGQFVAAVRDWELQWVGASGAVALSLECT